MQDQNPRNIASSTIPLIITHNMYNHPISNIIRANLHILHSATDLQCITESKLTVIHRRAKNIKNILVRSDINPKKFPAGSGPCDRPCIICPFMTKTTTIYCHATKENIPICGSYNCLSKNVIYSLSFKNVVFNT